MTMIRFRAVLLTALAACGTLAIPTVLSAQSAQKYAVQIALLSTTIGLGRSAVTTGGFGLEPQLRFNRLYASETGGAISLGIGGQWTTHSSGGDNLTIAGLFLEPRWVPVTSSSRLYPYLSGRLAYLQQSNNFGTSSMGPGFGAGAGLAVRLNRFTNIDAGVAVVRQGFGDFVYSDGSAGSFKSFTTYAAKIGLSWGFPRN